MDWDDRVERDHFEQALLWNYRYTQLEKQRLAAWVSGFRDGMPCTFDGDACGSFNWCCKFRFNDQVVWMVRFAVPGRVMNGDEKVQREVVAMRLIQDQTSIPVPKIHAWGLSADNPLGLGPFIIMDFVKGEELGKILKDPEGNVLRSDIPKESLDTIYRQIAGFLLQLWKLDFDKIGSLTQDNGPTSAFQVDARPCTLKAQEIQSHSGVDINCETAPPPPQPNLRTSTDIYFPGLPPTTFSSAQDYFQHIAGQDEKHLMEQLNSIDNEEDGRKKFIRSKTVRSLIPSFTFPGKQSGSFKLICDDFRLGNMLVNNRDDLQIIAVIDWEWSYAGPCELFVSPPRWLLMARPYIWDEHDTAAMISRYLDLFERFLCALEEEEDAEPAKGTQKQEDDIASPPLSVLMRNSMSNGSFWFNELVLSCFQDPSSFIWDQLQLHVPTLISGVSVPEEEIRKFVSLKMSHLATYNIEWEKRKTMIELQEIEVQKHKEKQRIERELGKDKS